MRWVRLLTGILLGAMLLGCFWFAGWLTPPESLQRRVALWAALYPLPTTGADVELVPCEPLPRVRFYILCTENCEGVWRIVAVKGLEVMPLANPARIPPESVTATRRRINEVVRAERIRPDDDQARRLVVFYLRLEGLAPARLLDEADRLAVEETRPQGEEALHDLADRIAEGDPLARIPIDRTDTGMDVNLLYWDTGRAGWPVLELRFRLAANGEVREVKARRLSQSPAEEPSE
ncbi:MAG TPA: hypothetical protein VFQ07_11370 [Candidatus Polarisedimenticolia bacterium]|nr:hypothetical protein [Candidatus Polarisedimenticolia bacterium]